MGNLTIFEPGDAGAAKADYRLEIGLSGGGADQHAEVALKSGDGSGVLWSTLTKGETGKLVDLHQQVAAQIGDLLDCLVRLDSKERAIDQASLALYLNACSNDGQTEQAAGVYRQLTNKSPQFAPGWGGLAVTLAMGVDFSHSAENEALVADARQALAKAKQLDPSLEENFVAEANLNPAGERDPGRELRLYDAGLKLHPDSAGLRGLRSQSLMSLGRMSEAIVDSDRALELNPISPSAREAYISALAYSGRSEAAFAKLREAEATWPGSQRFEDLRYNLNLRFGDARAAQDYLRRNGNIASTQGAQSWMAFLDARLRPGAAEIDRALDAFRGRYRINHAQVIGYVQAMGTFGRYDEAYQILQLPESANALRQGSEVLFRPFMKGFRDDPRFMMLAKRIGLVDEWQSSGVWPDFCGEADLPYNCRAEAAKLKSVPKPTS